MENMFFIFMFMKVQMFTKQQIEFMIEMKMEILILQLIQLKFLIYILERVVPI